MRYYVYILYSEKFDKYYKGYTTNPPVRLLQHNNGESRYTRHFVPWKLVFLQSYDTKSEALIRERKLKKYGIEKLRTLISSSVNEINHKAG